MDYSRNAEVYWNGRSNPNPYRIHAAATGINDMLGHNLGEFARPHQIGDALLIRPISVAHHLAGWQKLDSGDLMRFDPFVGIHLPV